jgi:hypothetical protein
MRNGDVRRTCLALVHNRVRTADAAADPPAVALGWQLERGRWSPAALAALCAGVLAGASAPSCWQPSATLRALLSECGAGDRERPMANAGRARTGAPPAHPVDTLA